MQHFIRKYNKTAPDGLLLYNSIRRNMQISFLLKALQSIAEQKRRDYEKVSHSNRLRISIENLEGYIKNFDSQKYSKQIELIEDIKINTYEVAKNDYFDILFDSNKNKAYSFMRYGLNGRDTYKPYIVDVTNFAPDDHTFNRALYDYHSPENAGILILLYHLKCRLEKDNEIAPDICSGDITSCTCDHSQWVNHSWHYGAYKIPDPARDLKDAVETFVKLRCPNIKTNFQYTHAEHHIQNLANNHSSKKTQGSTMDTKNSRQK